MKRKLWIMPVLIMAVICLLAGSALAGTDGGHTHSWREIRRIDSTCTTHGKVWYRCSCGESKVEELPLKSHKWKSWQTEREATCEEQGRESRKCKNCGYKEYRFTDALGHAWDEGVMTKEPGYLNPGEMTWTCTRCGATKTEEIPAKDLPVSLLNGGIGEDGLEPGEFGEVFDPLRIDVQPVGGFIDNDGGSMTLSVEAAGGTPPYTYQWRMRYNGWWSLYRDVENGTDSTVEAKKGNYKYYCKVYDSKGDHVASDTVVVGWNLYIAKQPENTADCEMDPVILTCEAAGGVPYSEDTDYPYAYTWMSADDEVMGYGPALTVEKMGEYYCVVTDNALNTTRSRTAIVYEADPFECKTDTPVVELRKGQDYELWAEAYGGIAPYAGVWMRDGVEIPTQQNDDGEFTAPIVGDGSKEVIYSFVAHDAMDDDCSLTVRVVYPQLKIAKQPEGGMLPEDSEALFEINIVMAEGEEPFTYHLTKDGNPDSAGEGEASYGFKVYDPGVYAIHVEDAAGNWADSDVVSVLAYSKELTISRTEFDPDITDQKTASLLVEVADGDGPYTYTLLKDGKTQDSKEVYGAYASFPIEEPGWYAMHIEDVNGRTAETKYMEAVDSRLRIVEQPQSVSFEYKPGVFPSATFVCKAEGNPSHPLTYQWEGKGANGWDTFKESPKNSITVTESFNESMHTYYQIHQAYRCIVRDTVTGEEIVSEEATVSFPMKVTAHQEGLDPTIIVSVEGGSSPYTFSCYRRRRNWKGDDYVVENVDLMAHWQVIGGDLHHSIEYRFSKLSKHGKKYYAAKYRYTHYSYYITVTDRYGNSETVRVHMQSNEDEMYYTIDGWQCINVDIDAI